MSFSASQELRGALEERVLNFWKALGAKWEQIGAKSEHWGVPGGF